MVLHSSQDAVAAMFASIENRTARLRMIEAAAKSSLPQAHFEIIDALFASQIKPAMKERDKLAHWYWGVADDLPDALLLADPSHHLFASLEAENLDTGPDEVPNILVDFEPFVVTAKDLERMSGRFNRAHEGLRLACGSVRQGSSESERAAKLAQLSNAREIREWLTRRASRHSDNSPESQR